MNRWLAVTALIGAIAISGCATTQLYGGAKLPPDKVVTVKGMVSIHPANAIPMVCAIDDKTLDSCATSVSFLPGHRKLLIKSKWLGITYGFETIDKEFLPGEVYQLGLKIYASGSQIPILIKE